MSKTYVAFAQAIPLAMSQRLVKSVQRGWRPDYEGADAVSRSRPIRSVVGASMLEEDADVADCDNKLTLSVSTRVSALALNVEMDDAFAPVIDAGGSAPTTGTPPLAPPGGAEILSDSEPSGAGDEDVAETALFFNTKAKGGGKALHVASEVRPTQTACRRGLLLETLTSVSLTPDQWRAATPATFCKACVKVRPDIFPDAVVAQVFPHTDRPGALSKAAPKARNPSGPVAR